MDKRSAVIYYQLALFVICVDMLTISCHFCKQIHNFAVYLNIFLSHYAAVF